MIMKTVLKCKLNLWLATISLDVQKTKYFTCDNIVFWLFKKLVNHDFFLNVCAYNTSELSFFPDL